MRTCAEGVWAAGDCVESVHRLSGQRVVVALGTHANKQGRVAGINIGGGYATFPGVIGTAITRICDLEAARTGLSTAEAEAAGYQFVTAVVDSTTKAGYFPGAQPIRVKMIAERRSGRLLGAQIVGREAAAKRVDALAICIWNEMGVDEILSLDLSYAPPFSPVWDPVLIAARKAFEAVESDVRLLRRAPAGAAPVGARRRRSGPVQRLAASVSGEEDGVPSQAGSTRSAWRPRWPSLASNSTRWPSSRL